MPDLLTTWATLKAQADKSDAEVLDRLARVYASGYERIDPQVQALTEQIDALQKAGKVTKAQIQKTAAYRNLMQAVQNELDDYTAYVRTELRTAVQDSAKSGLSAGNLLMLASLADSLGVDVKDIPAASVVAPTPDALSFLADYLDPDGALFGKLNKMSNYHADEVSATILDLVSQGKNPKVIGKFIQDAYGTGLSDSLRMMRTAQLYSYRQANNAVQVANADVLQGVVWCAELDADTCGSCISLHGQVFPVGTICEDHHGGRCGMLPLCKGMENPIQQTGEDWFKSQPENVQRDALGKGKFEAWQDGKFEFSALSTTYQDDIYGTMRREATLQELIGE